MAGSANYIRVDSNCCGCAISKDCGCSRIRQIFPEIQIIPKFFLDGSFQAQSPPLTFPKRKDEVNASIKSD